TGSGDSAYRARASTFRTTVRTIERTMQRPSGNTTVSPPHRQTRVRNLGAATARRMSTTPTPTRVTPPDNSRSRPGILPYSIRRPWRSGAFPSPFHQGFRRRLQAPPLGPGLSDPREQLQLLAVEVRLADDALVAKFVDLPRAL